MMRRSRWLVTLALAILSGAASAGDAKGADVRVRVVGPGRKPLNDVFVSVDVKAWPGGAFRVIRRDGRTDAKGVATFADVVPPSTKFGVYVAAIQPGSTLAARYVWSSKPMPLATFELATGPASETVLRLVDAKGGPVAGVAVGPSMRSDLSGERHPTFGSPHESSVVTSGADGLVKLSSFLPGEWVGVKIRPAPGADWESLELLVPTLAGAVVDVPVPTPVTPDRELTAGGDAAKRLFLTGPKAGDVEPAKGYGVLLVLPGGDGGDGIRGFVRDHYDDWVDAGWVCAELVAPVWDPKQVIVWPTDKSNVKAAKFTTEEFVEAALVEAEKSVRVDRRRVVAVSWSSSGPACWRMLSMKKSSITGHLIVMSVFRPAQLDPLANAKGRPLFLLHSPTDDRCPIAQAEQGRDAAKKAGLDVEWATYEGGHGWAGESETIARRALHWLAERAK